jgi:hypothetical protein
MRRGEIALHTKGFTDCFVGMRMNGYFELALFYSEVFLPSILYVKVLFLFQMGIILLLKKCVASSVN